jgi:hypothetical protein
VKIIAFSAVGNKKETGEKIGYSSEHPGKVLS